MSLKSGYTKACVNPVVAARRAAWANCFSAAVSRPALTALIAVLIFVSAVLAVGILHGLLTRHASTVLACLIGQAGGVWAAVFLLCLAILVPPARKDAAEAQAGWLSALPQMPQAMHRWSRWKGFTVAAVQAIILLIGVVSVHRLAPASRDLTAQDWLPAILVPLLAWLVLPLLTRPRNVAAGRPFFHPRAPDQATSIKPALVLAHWQWTDYLNRRWTVGMRWSLGLIVLLVPAGTGFLQVGMTLVLGLLGLQLLQLWSSSMRVVLEASALTAALPNSPRSFVPELSRVPLLTAALLVAFAFMTLAGIGVPAIAALALVLVIFGALVLQAATVLAWRDHPRCLSLRSAAVLLVWGASFQVVPFAAPLVWAAVVVWLLRQAGKEGA